jgi:threonine dehydrogenase-like Zn-dependent dehydrogenase
VGSRNALPEDFRAVIAMLERGHFPVDRAVSAIVSLEETPAMFSTWSSSPASFTKIMIQISK